MRSSRFVDFETFWRHTQRAVRQDRHDHQTCLHHTSCRCSLAVQIHHTSWWGCRSDCETIVWQDFRLCVTLAKLRSRSVDHVSFGLPGRNVQTFFPVVLAACGVMTIMTAWAAPLENDIALCFPSCLDSRFLFCSNSLWLDCSH